MADATTTARTLITPDDLPSFLSIFVLLLFQRRIAIRLPQTLFPIVTVHPHLLRLIEVQVEGFAAMNSFQMTDLLDSPSKHITDQRLHCISILDN